MAVVVATSYPGGPAGIAAWLEWRDLWPCVRSAASRCWTVAAVFAVLAALLGIVASSPSVWGFLTALCGGLALLCAMMPLVLAGNEIMTVYYIDPQWIACYRGMRRGSVDLTRVQAISAHVPGQCSFHQRWRSGVSIPAPILVLEPIQLTVSRAIHAGPPARRVQMSRRARAILKPGIAPALGFQVRSDIARPPFRAWNDVRRRQVRRRKTDH